MKILFVDWDRDKTDVRIINLSGEGFIQDARFERKHVFSGDYGQQVYEIARFIAEKQPDKVIVDSMGIGCGLSEELRRALDEMGITKNGNLIIPEYRPGKEVPFI